MARTMKTLDGNEAAASIAYRVNEICAIYPITPSSTMGELADQWASEGRKNIWGTVPHVVEMQSEGGAAGAVHGALQTGAMTTTFTASQGLLLMIPNMFKIAGELTPTVFHVAARSLAAQALSIFGDHSDVMAARMTGWAMLCSSSVQEAHDLALIAENATLASRIPFVHFFDGFRTSHEISKIEMLDDEDVRAMIDDDLVFAHRKRGAQPRSAGRPRRGAESRRLLPGPRDGEPVLRRACRATCRRRWTGSRRSPGRQYKLFDYFGAADAERVLVLMGSGAETARETIEYLNARGARLGLVQVHLFRPFSVDDLLDAIPLTAQIDCRARSHEGARRAGRAALSGCRHRVRRGRRHRPPRVHAPHRRRPLRPVVEGVHAGDGEGGVRQPARPPRRRTTSPSASTTTSRTPASTTTARSSPRTRTSSAACSTASARTAPSGRTRTRSRSSARRPPGYAQGFFVYDSKKSGSKTTSHLRFGPRPIRSTYLVQRARFVACHQFQFVEQVEMLREAIDGAVFLLNSPFGPDRVWDELPRRMQEDLIRKRIRLYVIDADTVAADAGHGGTHQHHHADLLLRDLGRAAARGGDPEDQGRHRGNLREEGPRARRAELRGRGPDARVIFTR